MKNKSVLMACVLLLFFCGCNTYKKQLTNFQGFAMQHTNELSKLCAAVFPVKDSVGTPVQKYQPADNKNYQSTIDSLQQLADNVNDRIDTVIKTMPSPELSVLKNHVNTLTNRITDLKNSYQKCKPDTVKIEIPHFVQDRAALNVAMVNYNVARDSVNLLQERLKSSNESNSSKVKWLWILGGLALMLGALSVWKILK